MHCWIVKLLDLLIQEIKAMQEKYERDVKILHDRIDLLVLEVEKIKRTTNENFRKYR